MSATSNMAEKLNDARCGRPRKLAKVAVEQRIGRGILGLKCGRSRYTGAAIPLSVVTRQTSPMPIPLMSRRRCRASLIAAATATDRCPGCPSDRPHIIGRGTDRADARSAPEISKDG
jgi:hypothetical protein